MVRVSVRVNGTLHDLDVDLDLDLDLDVDRDRSLLAFLRNDLGLTGAKPGCGEGQCGACTVLLEGDPALACQIRLEETSGSSITTIEGLAPPGKLHPVQDALISMRASQCGYCTPAMALRAAALLAGNFEPDDGRIASAMNPNICRCGCYSRITYAIRRAAAAIRDGVEWSSAEAPPHLRSLLPTTPLANPRKPWDLLEVGERDWVEVLGDGLVAVWPPAPVAAGMWPMGGGAWLHVAPSERVIAFTGKVDVGQDNRTAFALLVAEELFSPLELVEVVLGDTDLCPFDMGTFGSMSMPVAGEALRRAAAGARRALLDLAAGHLSSPIDALSTPGDGSIVGPGGVRVRYGKLLEGLRLVEVIEEEPPLVSPASWRLAGRSGPSPVRYDVVRGERCFVSDLELPGMLHGAVLRPRVPGASLRVVDLERARRLPGVTTLRDGDFVGVAAPDPASARHALGVIGSEWDDSPPGVDDLQSYLRAHPAAATGWERAQDDITGDVEAALEDAVICLEATYTASYIAHMPLETRAAVAQWKSGRLTVWTGTQVPFGVRSQLAEALELDESQIRVIVPPTGGAFGGKHGAQVALEAARLSREAGCPVKVHWNRVEELTLGGLRPMAVIDVRSSLDDSGSITAWDFTNINSGAAGLACPYAIPNQRLCYQPAASPLAQISYRALAATANHFARESHIDELAHAARSDPLEFRLRNLEDARLAAVVEAAAERFDWGAGGETAGVAAGLEKQGRVATCAEVSEDDRGQIRVNRIVTAYECGAVANVDAVLNQIEGATVMALGGALFEAVDVQHGRFREPSLAHYRVPRFCDVPAIDVVLLERRDIPSAGAGETPMVAVAPAVANAIFAATSTRLRSLPLIPGGSAPDLP